MTARQAPFPEVVLLCDLAGRCREVLHDPAGLCAGACAGAGEPGRPFCDLVADADRGRAEEFLAVLAAGEAAIGVPLAPAAGDGEALVWGGEHHGDDLLLVGAAPGRWRPLLERYGWGAVAPPPGRGAAELDRANRELERLRRGQSEYLHMLVHDLRTPLNSLGLNLELLASIAGAGVAGVAGRSQKVIAHLAALLGDVLDLARLETAAMPLERKPVALEAAVGEALAVTGQRRGEAEVERDLPAGLAVDADPRLLKRVLANLLDNAFKHGGGASVRIAARPVEGGVRVEVIDRGPGIPEADREAVFDRFTRTARGGGAVGLGLAYCKVAVEAHGGAIGIEDAPGGAGSAFWFTLPAAG